MRETYNQKVTGLIPTAEKESRVSCLLTDHLWTVKHRLNVLIYKTMAKKAHNLRSSHFSFKTNKTVFQVKKYHLCFGKYENTLWTENETASKKAIILFYLHKYSSGLRCDGSLWNIFKWSWNWILNHEVDVSKRLFPAHFKHKNKNK